MNPATEVGGFLDARLLKLSEASEDSEVRKRAAKVLAQAYGGDPGSVEAGHCGSLREGYRLFQDGLDDRPRYVPIRAVL